MPGYMPPGLVTVRLICGHCDTVTAEQFGAILAPGCSYINMRWPDRIHRHPDAAFSLLDGCRSASDFDLEILHDATSGDVVLAERTERVR